MLAALKAVQSVVATLQTELKHFVRRLPKSKISVNVSKLLI